MRCYRKETTILWNNPLWTQLILIKWYNVSLLQPNSNACYTTCLYFPHNVYVSYILSVSMHKSLWYTRGVMCTVGCCCWKQASVVICRFLVKSTSKWLYQDVRDYGLFSVNVIYVLIWICGVVKNMEVNKQAVAPCKPMFMVWFAFDTKKSLQANSSLN